MGVQVRESPSGDDRGGSLMDLGQLNVDCGADGAISEFKVVRDGPSKVSLPVFRLSLTLSVPIPPLSC